MSSKSSTMAPEDGAKAILRATWKAKTPHASSTKPNRFHLINGDPLFNPTQVTTKRWRNITVPASCHATFPLLTKARKIHLYYRCLQKGHLRTNCKNPLKCLKCRHPGHRLALFKEHISTTEAHRNTKKDTKMDFNFHAERSDSWDVFFPNRQYLSEEIAYLKRTRMVMLLEGAPTPGLHVAIATGGQPSDYFVFNAAISPHLLVSPGPRIRDAIVRHGVYNIDHL